MEGRERERGGWWKGNETDDGYSKQAKRSSAGVCPLHELTSHRTDTTSFK